MHDQVVDATYDMPVYAALGRLGGEPPAENHADYDPANAFDNYEPVAAIFGVAWENVPGAVHYAPIYAFRGAVAGDANVLETRTIGVRPAPPERPGTGGQSLHGYFLAPA